MVLFFRRCAYWARSLRRFRRYRGEKKDFYEDQGAWPGISNVIGVLTLNMKLVER
jgi:hypothetical protein